MKGSIHLKGCRNEPLFFTVKYQYLKQDVIAYMKYYNIERLQTAKENRSPVDFENGVQFRLTRSGGYPRQKLLIVKHADID